MKPPLHTARDFEVFKRECRRMVEKLGLKGWRIVYLMVDLEDAYGDFHANHVGRIATIRMNRRRDPGAAEDVKRVARHEVLELFLARFEWIAESRWATGQDLAEEKHNVIRTLENLL